jgi:hypothetical protein
MYGAEGVARDAGDVILSWLTRIIVIMALTAVIAFDALSLAVARVSAIDDANSAARSASIAFKSSKGDLDATLAAAEASASEHGETVLPTSLQVDADDTVHLKLQREATTLVVRHLGPLSKWATVVVKGSGRADPAS